jgi:methyl-accepting chemotaxis protein
VDINLNSLQALSQEASRSLYDGQTTVGILSPVGLLAGYSADASKLAQRLDQVDRPRAPSWCASWPMAR